MKLSLVLPTATAVLAITLTGCSTDAPTSGAPSSAAAGSSTTAAGAVFTDADVTFLTDMYPHHAQALEMATLVEGRSTNQAVIDLATKIKGEQQPEMDTMTTLLTSFGKPAPTTTGGMDTSGASGMAGMMSPQDMIRLGTLTGAEFDTTWLTMMVAHHTGAIEMANAELSAGTNPDTRQLATAIIAAQQAEIDTMNGLLAQS
ncbi:DUF305 domain-containing protein [Rhodococcus aerolatus]